jgi:hypothetical protein
MNGAEQTSREPLRKRIHRIYRYWYSRLFNRDQAYFWTKEWQEGERASEADYAAGRYEEFDNMDDLSAWLGSATGEATYPVNPSATEATS